MDKPRLLYKYRPASLQDLTNLSSAKLWISNPSHFNDPFDCAYSVQVPEFNRNDCERMLEWASEGRFNKSSLARFDDLELQRQIQSGLNTVIKTALSQVGGVCCFSAVLDNLLMWGHYADSHRGFCLEFDTKDEPLFAKTKPVSYSDTLPALSKETFTQLDLKQVLALLLTKAKCWEYEREWRVLHQKANFAYSYNRSCLKSVYFGARMPEDQMMLVAHLLHNTNTKLFRMRLSSSTFELVSESVTFEPVDYRASRINETTLAAPSQ